MDRRTDWFQRAGWGVFVHYLGTIDSSPDGMESGELSPADWNRRVNSFDVQRFADTVQRTGAGYAFITIGQNSGHFCSPNPVYDALVGDTESRCSKRDLISDLADAMNERGLKLMVYLPSGAPAGYQKAVEALEWAWGFEGGWPNGWGEKRTGKRLAAFQLKWEQIIREWSLRWGKKIGGWWIDGCYFADEMYRHDQAPNFKSFAAALRAGNPDSILAFNPGVLLPVIRLCEEEDYTAGEIAEALPACPGASVDGAQFHMLSYLGSTWCRGSEPRFSDELAGAYTAHVVMGGGVVSWDVPIEPDGRIPEAFVRQLSAIGRAVEARRAQGK